MIMITRREQRPKTDFGTYPNHLLQLTTKHSGEEDRKSTAKEYAKKANSQRKPTPV